MNARLGDAVLVAIDNAVTSGVLIGTQTGLTNGEETETYLVKYWDADGEERTSFFSDDQIQEINSYNSHEYGTFVRAKTNTDTAIKHGRQLKEKPAPTSSVVATAAEELKAGDPIKIEDGVATKVSMSPEATDRLATEPL